MDNYDNNFNAEAIDKHSVTSLSQLKSIKS